MKQIFDIFSKKKLEEKDIEKIKISIDFREKNSLVASKLVNLGFEIEFKTLEIGDYVVNDVVIERKTVSDFISSMLNRRLVSQLENMRQYENKLLIIEGLDEQELYSDSKEIQGVHPNSIRGFLISILLKYKIPIVYAKDYEDTAKFISVLAKRKEKESPLNVARKSLDKKERMQFILEGFPGIGPKTAKKLLKEFGTIKNILNASKEDLKKITGKKAEIFRIAGEEY